MENPADLQRKTSRRFATWCSSGSVKLILVLWLATSILAALLGPFGTYSGMTPVGRLAYWTVIAAAAFGFGGAVRWLTARAPDLPRPFLDILGCALMAGSFGPFVWALNRVIVDAPGELPLTLAGHVFAVFGVGMCLALAVLALAPRARPAERRAVSAPAPYPADEASDAAPILRRIAPELGGDVLYARADGHYMLVETSEGTNRVLMRFADGVEALADFDGQRVHRSHWVARRAVAGVDYHGRRPVVVLRCGRRVPVSRSYAEDLPRLTAGA